MSNIYIYMYNKKILKIKMIYFIYIYSINKRVHRSKYKNVGATNP